MSVGSVAVVDTWAALAFLRREGSADTTMRRYLKRADRGNVRLLMNLVNLGEVYYRMIRDLDARGHGPRAPGAGTGEGRLDRQDPNREGGRDGGANAAHSA